MATNTLPKPQVRGDPTSPIRQKELARTKTMLRPWRTSPMTHSGPRTELAQPASEYNGTTRHMAQQPNPPTATQGLLNR